MTTFRVLVVDDRAMPRIAAKAMLSGASDLIHVGEAASGQEALKLLPRLRPDIVLLDVEMPQMDGAETARQLLRARPDLKVVAWTVSDSSDDLLGMMQAGCAGYVLKDVGPDELQRAIRAALRQESPIPRRMLPDVLRRAARHALPTTVTDVRLTEREKEILRFAVRGLPTKRMALEMGISGSSVDTHLRNIYRKLKVNNRGEAVNAALKLGFVSLADL